jgi:hypothetical protein
VTINPALSDRLTAELQRRYASWREARKRLHDVFADELGPLPEDLPVGTAGLVTPATAPTVQKPVSCLVPTQPSKNRHALSGHGLCRSRRGALSDDTVDGTAAIANYKPVLDYPAGGTRVRAAREPALTSPRR